MSPLYRNIAIAAALVAVPAAVTAAVGTERVRAFPSRMGDRVRDWWDDESLEANLRRMASRLDDLTDRIDLDGVGQRDRSWGLLSAILGVAVIVPAAIAAFAGSGRLGDLRDRIGEFGEDIEDAVEVDEEAVAKDLSRLTARLDALNADLDAQRESNFDSVTEAARNAKS